MHPRRPLAAAFTLLYSVVALGGYGLHAWAPCGDTACRVDHQAGCHQAGCGGHGATQRPTIGPTAGNRPSPAAAVQDGPHAACAGAHRTATPRPAADAAPSCCDHHAGMPDAGMPDASFPELSESAANAVAAGKPAANAATAVAAAPTPPRGTATGEPVVRSASSAHDAAGCLICALLAKLKQSSPLQSARLLIVPAASAPLLSVVAAEPCPPSLPHAPRGPPRTTA